LGPNQAFYFAEMQILLCGPDTTPVTSFEGVSIIPTATFASCPQADILFVPGGDGPMDVFRQGPPGNNAYLQYLQKQASGAKLVCSVCTGSILLAGAGLLNDHVVTTHWAYKPVLSLFPCKVVDDFRRHVQSGNRVTGAGISSGLDEALYIVGLVRGVRVAREVQLKMQYHPQPSFHCGDPADGDIQDDPEMVASVVAQWQIQEAKEQVAAWMKS
jgi:cyclohexyl-isocyanide hydratase